MWNVLLWNVLCLIPPAIEMAKKILIEKRWDESLLIYSRFKVHRNNHLVSYVSLMYRYGIKYKHVLFDIFLWRTLINSYKMSIINHKLTIYAILCQNVTMFYQKELTSLSKVQENVKIHKNSKWNFLSCCLQVTVM